MINIKSYIKQHHFIRNVCILMSGTVFSQIVNVMTIPLLARLYTPEDFGLYALFVSVASILSLGVTGRYELAIILVENKKERINLLALCLLICFFFILSMLGIVFLVLQLKFFYYPFIEQWGILLSLYLLSTGIYQSLYMWFNKENQYKVMTKGNVISVLSYAFFSVIFSFNIQNGMIISIILAKFVVVLYFISFFLKKERGLIRDIHFCIINIMKTRYNKFPKFIIAGNIVDAMAVQLPIILLGIFYGNTITGYYSLAYRCMSMPIGLISKSLGEVFRQHIIAANNGGKNCIIFYDKILQVLSLSAIAFIILLFSCTDWAISKLFGDGWETSAHYIHILTVTFALQLISSPLTNMFILGQRQKQYILLQIGYFVIGIISLSGGFYLFKDANWSLGIYGITFAILHFLNIYLSRNIAKRMSY